ncbi:metallopeptidase family protein [Acidithiobacillus sp.]
MEEDNETFLAAAEAALAALPDWVTGAFENIAFIVEDFPDAATREETGISGAYGLLGLYRGTPISGRGAGYGYGNLPDVIHLYREPILAYAAERKMDWRRCVQHVVVHEVGHYLGLSDAQMMAIEGDQDGREALTED